MGAGLIFSSSPILDGQQPSCIRFLISFFTKLPGVWIKTSYLALSYEVLDSTQISATIFGVGLAWYSMLPGLHGLARYAGNFDGCASPIDCAVYSCVCCALL